MQKHLEDSGKKNKYNNIFTTLGASNHSLEEREELDYYATDPEMLKLLLKEKDFNKFIPIFEPCAGGGHLVEVLKENGYSVLTNDISYHGYKTDYNFDFLKSDIKDSLSVNILTNPPYKLCLEFVKKSLEIIKENYKVIMLLKIQFLEGIERYNFFKENPPKEIYVFSKRYPCAKNGEFYKDGKKIGSAICYAWFIWEKGFKGDPIIKWLI